MKLTHLQYIHAGVYCICCGCLLWGGGAGEMHPGVNDMYKGGGMEWRDGCVGKAEVDGGRVGKRVDGSDRTEMDGVWQFMHSSMHPFACAFMHSSMHSSIQSYT